MSDDRFDDNRHPLDDSNEPDDYGEDDKTQLVDLDALQDGGGGDDEPQFAPPPTMDSMPAVDGPEGADDKTELFEIPSSMDDDGGAITSSAPDYSDNSFDNSQDPQHQPPPSHGQGHGQGHQQQPPSHGQGHGQGGPGHGHQQPPSHGQGHGQGHQQQPPSHGQGHSHQQPPSHGQGQGHQQQHQPPPSHGQGHQQHQPPPSSQHGGQNPSSPPVQGGGSGGGSFSSVDSDAGAFGASDSLSADAGGQQRDQVVIPGSDNTSHDGATAFINVADFAEEKAHFTPEQQEAGYDGSTQFVDVNALMAGSDDASGGDPIDNDEDLHRGYQFGADDIKRDDDITLIEAQNPLGKSVILKRIWEGRPDEMTTPLRERIAQLHDLQHPNLLNMNGMFVSDSGMWVELQAPRGERLTTILQDGGPFPTDGAVELLNPVADVLKIIHGQQLAYANLTTDSIWLENNGNVLIEPFDMLKLEDRGNLGAFGPPEMDAPPEQRHLSPASDVYSLAAVIAAMITGLPLRPQNLGQHDDQKFVEKLQKALDQDPANRPQSAPEFLASLQGGDGPDMKIIVGGLVAVMFLGAAALTVLDDDDPPPEPPPPDETEAQAEAATDEETGAAPTDDAEEHPEIELPGSVTSDPRLTIETSFRQNPPGDAIVHASDEQLDEWRQQVDDLIEKAEDQSSDSEKLTHYSEALAILGQLIRKQDDPAQDLETWRSIYADQVVQDEIDSVVENIREPLLDGRLGSASRRYNRLAGIDPNATAHSFFHAHNNAEVIELTRDGAEEDDDD